MALSAPQDRLVPHVSALGREVRSFASRLQRSDPATLAPAALQWLRQIVVYPIVSVALTTFGFFAILQWFSALRFEPIVYLIPVVICAIQWGLASALVCILASAALWDFLFLPPLYSLAISDPNHIVEMALFLFVALATSKLAARAKNEADACLRREQELHNLFEFSRRLALCSTMGDLVKAIQEYLSGHLGCEAYLIRLGTEASPYQVDIGIPPACEPIAQEIRDIAQTGGSTSRRVLDPQTKTLWVLKSLSSKSAERRVLAVNLGTHAVPDAHEYVDSLLDEASATLARIDADAALANVAVRIESEALKTALIGTASHELRSPVAAILGSASVLDEIVALRADKELRALVSGMRREAKRLDADIQNLLDTVRITDSGIKLHLIWTDPADCFAAAIRQRADRISGHRLKVDIEPDLPLLQVDPVLLEQAVGQVIENAAKYSPPDSEIKIVACHRSDEIILSVTDQGVGLTGEEASQLFRRAVRGRRHVGQVPGLGLGLWIASIFINANGGTLSADSPGSGLGTTMSIRLPVHQTAGRAAAALDAQAS